MVSDRDAIAAAVDAAIAANPQAIEELKKGKKKPEAVKGFLRGQVMKQTNGKANPARGRGAARDEAGRPQALMLYAVLDLAPPRAGRLKRGAAETWGFISRFPPELVQLGEVADLQVGAVGFGVVILGIEPDGEHPGPAAPFDVRRLAVADHGRLAARASEPFDGDTEERRLRLADRHRLGAACHGDRSGQGTAAGVKEAGADREPTVEVDCEERRTGGNCPCGCRSRS